MEFAAYRDLALSTLDRARIKLRHTIPTGDDELQFRLTDLSDPDGINDVVCRLRSKLSAPACVIYCFELLDASGYRLLKTRFQAAASHCEYSGRKLKYSRLSNEANPAALYVGSSKSFRSRFSQHLGLTGGSETYAMRLKQWASWDPLDVKLSFWFFSSDIDPWTLELLEQALWDAKRPLLGKRSGR